MKKVIAALALIIFSFQPAKAVNLPDPAQDEVLTSKPGIQSIVLAGGCFWGIQAVFQHLKGVKEAISGYAGGAADTAHYEEVSTGTTGHAESVKITYDPSQITLGKILKVYFAVAHNPTQLNKQSPDHGTQYRSTIFYSSDEQKKLAAGYIAELKQKKLFSEPVVTTLEPLKAFYPAEGYHQDYAKLNPYNPYILINDLPKVEHLKKEYPELYTK